jgi:NAD(P)-dependent dehydrogenase (short-subunit alcohol dehydrogenase family)
MVGRRVLVVGAGQTDYHIEDQPIGNGRAISILLAREGAKVAAADYDQAAVDGTVALIAAGGGDAKAIIADVAHPGEIEEMIDQARDWLGGIDGVVYNVGIPGPFTLTDSDADSWEHTLNVNLRGAMLTARTALPVMEPGSAFVFISSVAALNPGGALLAYSASKSGMAALMRSVAVVGQDRAIRANIVMPGGIDTGIARHVRWGGSPPPPSSRRLGTAWEIAYPTLFLLSNEAAFISGQILAVHAGGVEQL